MKNIDLMTQFAALVPQNKNIFLSLVMVSLTACGTNPKWEPTSLLNDQGKVTFLRGPDFEIEKIIGANDLIPVTQNGANIPAKYRPLIDAFGKLSMGCSATHIGKGLVLTAGHCFYAGSTPQKNVSCGNTSVQWGLRRDKAAYLTSKCTKILIMQMNDDVDYAILQVDKIPEALVEVDTSNKPAIGRTITIFGHPQGRPLEWSQLCTVQPASNGAYGRGHFSHQCDTEPGNSGSSVIDDSTLKVIGVHDGGIVPWNYATFILDTPIKDYIVPPAEPGILTFGPFGNNENRLLTTFPKSLGTQVSFKLTIDTEKSYDFVVVTDGKGVAKRYSGAQTLSFSSITTPVTLRFTSDGSVTSKKVQVGGMTSIK